MKAIVFALPICLLLAACGGSGGGSPAESRIGARDGQPDPFTIAWEPVPDGVYDLISFSTHLDESTPPSFLLNLTSKRVVVEGGLVRIEVLTESGVCGAPNLPPPLECVYGKSPALYAYETFGPADFAYLEGGGKDGLLVLYALFSERSPATGDELFREYHTLTFGRVR